MDKQQLTQQIKSEALKLGFAACGIAQADYLDNDAAYLKSWLAEGMHGSMSYMANHFEKRTDPRLLVDNVRSVIVVLLNYFPREIQNKSLPQIAKYAYGKDYHEVIKNKLHQLLQNITAIPSGKPITGRAFTDSAPVLERRWAERAGLGWIGKNGNLIHPQFGSFCFIGELIVDAELDYDCPITDHCGTCSRCLEVCPTQALEAPRKLNANRCISYLTIERKEEIPVYFHSKLSNRLFGCDICQDVCTWNKKAQATNIEEFKPIEELLELTKEDWLNLSEEKFNAMLASSSLKRAGYKKIIGTAKYL